MRKIVFLFIFVIAACAPVAPDVAVTSEVTAAFSPEELTTPSIPTSTATPESVVELSPASFTCWTEDIKNGCLNLVEKPGMNIAEKLQIAWFTGPSYEEFWKDTLGMDSKPTEEQVRKWVEANGWHIPLKSPSGIDFPWLQAESPNAKGRMFAKFALLDNETVQDLGYINASKGVRFMLFGPDEWEVDASGVQTEFERLMELNGTSWPMFIGLSRIQSANEIGGVLLDEEGIPIVVIGSTQRSDYYRQHGFDKFFLGGEGAVPQEIVSAWMEVLVRAMGTMENDEKLMGRASDGKCYKFTLDQDNRTGSCIKVPEYFKGDNAWFVPVSEEEN